MIRPIVAVRRNLELDPARLEGGIPLHGVLTN
jgi:hypothetical protein